MKKILIFPKGKNPYQQLLYSHIDKRLCLTTYLPEPTKSRTLNFLLFYWFALVYRLRGYGIFHLHWLDFSLPLQNVIIYHISFLNSVISLIWIRVLGYKIVWTVHNVLPHHQQTSNDQFITQLATCISQHLILHSKQTTLALKKINAKTKKYSIIPVGKYDFFPNTINGDQARKFLNLKKNDFVFLFFGYVKKYKGVENLLESFEKICLKHYNLKLVIAGECSDNSLIQAVQTAQTKNRDKILFFNQHIPDVQVQYYFNSCTVCVFPFDEITTSSSLHVALQFHKPIIAPLLGNVVDLPKKLGFFYHPAQQDGLSQAMIEAVEVSGILHQFDREVDEYLETLSWEKIGQQTQIVYDLLQK